jgi:hypothetical protein
MFFILSFLLFILQSQRTGGLNKSCLEGMAGTIRREEVLGNGGRRMNTLEKMCAHVSKCKNDACVNLLQVSGERGG